MTDEKTLNASRNLVAAAGRLIAYFSAGDAFDEAAESLRAALNDYEIAAHIERSDKLQYFENVIALAGPGDPKAAVIRELLVSLRRSRESEEALTKSLKLERARATALEAKLNNAIKALR